MISYSEFYKIVKENSSYDELRNLFRDESDEDINRLSITWNLSGTIRNCYGFERDVEEEKEPQFQVLDKILEITSPKISFMQYKAIERMIDYRKIDTSDYYSNIYQGCRSIELHKLYKYLEENNLLIDNYETPEKVYY